MQYRGRKLNAFEKILLVIGLLTIVLGYIFTYKLILIEGFTFMALQATFLWLIVVILIIQTAVNENMKEELRIIIINQVDEVKLLRDDLRRK